MVVERRVGNWGHLHGVGKRAGGITPMEKLGAGVCFGTPILRLLMVDTFFF